VRLGWPGEGASCSTASILWATTSSEHSPAPVGSPAIDGDDEGDDTATAPSWDTIVDGGAGHDRVARLRDRRPGMMLLTTMVAITVAYSGSLGWFDFELWWEMKALGQASSTLDALAALLPDTADHVVADGRASRLRVALPQNRNAANFDSSSPARSPTLQLVLGSFDSPRAKRS
jgi:hypothetical protein